MNDLLLLLAISGAVGVGAFVVLKLRFTAALRRDGRWMEWEAVEQRLLDGEGTVILNRTNSPGAVWWTERVLTATEAKVALLTDANLTNCPRRLRNKVQLETLFPNAAVLEVTGTIRQSS